MTRQALEETLNYAKAYRASRQEAANWVLAHPDCFKDLLTFVGQEATDRSHKAAWVLEFVCKAKMELLLPHLDLFCELIQKVTKDQTKRPMAKITELLCLGYYKQGDSKIQVALKQEHRQAFTAACFDWVINEEKVACKAYSIQSLYWLGTEFDWVHPELKLILQEGYAKHSAGYKARTRTFLAMMEKYQAEKQ
ncbi:adenylosuccinate lyase [Gilvibacter sp.]|uniref:adenylosuccinate lyase n=1 Tax=Gilvibacter sp. TaxID=2729997 RepID=UPI0035BE801E